MGLYDSFYVKTKCPRCGQEEIFEFQTKAFDPALREWKEGEPFFHPLIEIREGKIRDCIAVHEDCSNPKVVDEYDNGYIRKFTTFVGDVIIKGGKVAGVENIRELDW